MKHLNDSMELCSITKGENSQIIYLFAEEIHISFAKGYATELFILFSYEYKTYCFCSYEYDCFINWHLI